MEFLLTYQPLSDICRCIDKMSDNKHVFFRQDRNNFRIYAKSTEFYVDFVGSLFTDLTEFGFGVDSKQFLALIKKMDKKDVKFSVDKSRLSVQQGSIKAKLPMLDNILDFANLTDLPRFECPGFLDDLEFCAKSVKEDKRFKGIVVESGQVTNLAKVGFASCGTSQGGTYSFGDVRFIVSSGAASVLKGFDDEHKKCLVLSSNVFGVEFFSGVTLYSMLLADQHPQELFTMFGSPVGASFKINRKALVESLEMISSVMGDEMGVRWDWNAAEKSWQLSCKTYKGAEITESVMSEIGAEVFESFGVHRKAMLDILKAFDKSVEEVFVFPGTGPFVYVTAGRYVAALTKMSL